MRVSHADRFHMGTDFSLNNPLLRKAPSGCLKGYRRESVHGFLSAQKANGRNGLSRELKTILGNAVAEIGRLVEAKGSNLRAGGWLSKSGLPPAQLVLERPSNIPIAPTEPAETSERNRRSVPRRSTMESG